TTPSASGDNVTVTHKWTKKGTYQVKAKAKDIYGSESGWTTISVSVPRVISVNVLLHRILERFPHAFPILRKIIAA
ncbi:MAG: PKD domain-containing protein, partial [Thermoplasmatota archaeon]